jgi:hypothetical protein
MKRVLVLVAAIGVILPVAAKGRWNLASLSSDSAQLTLE